MTRVGKFVFGVGIVGLATLSSVPARAQGSDKVAAEALFSEARKLMAAHKFAEACPKLAASLRLDRGVGTMLNLADCYEQNGQTASAWAEFREAISSARDANSPQREKLARDRAAAIEPKLSKLTISIDPNRTRSAQVKRDGEGVDPALFGTPMPVNPGTHVIEVSAPGKKMWTATVEVGGNAAQVSVNVPALEDDPTAARPGAAGPPAPMGVGVAPGYPPPGQPPGQGMPPPGADTGHRGSGQRTAGLVVGGVGMVGLAVGTIFGLSAQSSWSKAKDACPSKVGCSGTAVDDQKSATSSATLSTVGFVVGGLGVATGAILLLTAPSSSSSTTGSGWSSGHASAPNAERPERRSLASAGSVRVESVDVGPLGFVVRGSF